MPMIKFRSKNINNYEGHLFIKRPKMLSLRRNALNFVIQDRKCGEGVQQMGLYVFFLEKIMLIESIWFFKDSIKATVVILFIQQETVLSVRYMIKVVSILPLWKAI